MVFKIHLILVLFLVPVLSINAGITEIYKKGTIELKPVVYQTENDWVELFLNGNAGLAVAPDGRIFVSNNRQHCVFIFDSQGNLTGKFGQKGEGPGDLYAPGNLSTLDGKYLVVGEYASRRRISLFHLDGKHAKVIKTNGSVFSPLALGDGKIAYLITRYPKDKSKPVTKWGVYIKDIYSGKEKEIDSFEHEARAIQTKTGGRITFGQSTGRVVLKRIQNGNLLVGSSIIPIVKIYSPDGKLLNTIKLEISPIKVTDEYIRKFKKQAIKGWKEELPANDFLFFEKILKKASFKQLFLEFLPYYKRIMVDHEGNILVFKRLACLDKGTETVQVYSADGKFICETTFIGSILDFQQTDVDRNMVFTDKGIIGVFRLPDDDDESYKLMKVEYKY